VTQPTKESGKREPMRLRCSECLREVELQDGHIVLVHQGNDDCGGFMEIVEADELVERPE
jgi:hypothetical protein